MAIDINRKKLVQWGTASLFAGSFALFSFFQLIQYQPGFVILTLLLSFTGALVFVRKTGGEVCAYIRPHPLKCAAALLAASAVILSMRQAKQPAHEDVQAFPLLSQLFRLGWWLLAIPALAYLLLWLWRKADGFFQELWHDMDRQDKILYWTAAIGLSAVVIAAYRLNPQWYLQFDVVYSIDSGWCYQSIFPQPAYYDIRHPTLSVVTFPIWAVIHGGLRLIVPSQLLEPLCAACLQMVNIQALLLTGLMLEKLAKSRWILPLYLASSPVLLFTMFFEKYQLCTFLLVLYAYQVCRKGGDGEGNIVVASGAMPTSLFLFAGSLLVRGSLVHKLKSLARTAALGVMFLIGSGRIHLLNPQALLQEVSLMANWFGLKNLSVKECLFSFTQMVHGSFLGISSESGQQYVWTHILDSVSVLGVILLGVIAVGLVSNWRDRFVRFCAVWVAAGLVLFVGVQWSVQESPLFSLYFSWALIPLFQKGLQFIIDRLHRKDRTVYLALILPMFVINAVQIADIGIFLK